ncbi:WW domain-binding protein 4 [Tripterygium wilfordii]|uniref:WW domain-binding protein 4 n=1 Tax=Tripterygium wilfordii TaxID=458696 RepID=A0A7J7DY63_TRIWF|nr:zinc finger protein ZOP1-like isoform X1 [Tripterygium wilfordii]XP_038718502.1 zinc finger protein ZOP1-like isoform X1 [Tripterygium wilfordii]KAF5751219.1 WW domain-binding protein 4 [Tripterygium wilfordii]
MTEYWVSQGNKWCDFCKIYISSNPSSIRNHELGQRHKDSVSNRLTSMRKEKAAKEKEEKEAVRALEQIEAKAKRSYQKDIAKIQEARESNAHAPDFLGDNEEDWQYDSSSGYHYNSGNGLYYDPNSGFYYSDAIGKWVTQEEAYASTVVLPDSRRKESTLKKPTSTSEASSVNAKKGPAGNGPAPGPVVAASLNPMRSVKGVPSSFAVNKRKRQDVKVKPKTISEEEKAALKAREAANKRVENREKPLLGLYKH